DRRRRVRPQPAQITGQLPRLLALASALRSPQGNVPAAGRLSARARRTPAAGRLTSHPPNRWFESGRRIWLLADPASTVTGMDDLITPEQRYRDVLHHQAAGERHRLEQLAAANDQASFDQLVALRPPPDGRFLELGSGLGTLVRRLAVEFPS